ncbi:MAG TPA: TIGR03663 family protein [Phycisphaerae bacterium]|nr:TIGR03663 family protein [Phycisphaerae bacterium]
MKPEHLYRLIFALIVAGGLALRLPRLELRPMHGDEAVHAVKFETLWQTGDYVYDPHEYHGPVLYYATFPFVWLSGAQSLAELDEQTLRVGPALFGAGIIALLLLLLDGLGWRVVLATAALTAVSPIMTFYSRYYIQEMLLAFFALLVICAGWRYWQTGNPGWALLGGVGVGLMHATKETSIISLGCMAAALGVVAVWQRRSGTKERAGEEPEKGIEGSRDRGIKKNVVVWGDLVVAAGVAILVSVLFYSAFFRHWRGPLDSVLTYATYFERAGGHGLHDHPWYYYLQMLGFTHLARGPRWSEGLILGLALAGIGVAVTGAGLSDQPRRLGLVRFIAVYAVLMTVVYSVIPYKTPWCAVQFVQPLIMLAGLGAVGIISWVKPWPAKAVAAVILLAGAAHLGWQAQRANFRFFVDYRNPYVYAHPLGDVKYLSAYLEKLADVHPDGYRMLVKVIAEDAWPLPWYLRGFERVGYWEAPPAELDAPVVIVAGDLAASLPAGFENDYKISFYGLRPDIQLVTYVERELWQEFARRQEHLAPGPVRERE